MDHAFEDIEVKRNAPELLESALRSRRKRCMIGTGSMSDPYLPCEEQLGLTRRRGDREYYYAALDRHFPGLKERYIRRYGEAYELPSPQSERLGALFRETCEAHGILHRPEDCFRYLAAFPDRYEQLSVFDA